MSQPLWAWDWDYLWHFLGGAAIQGFTIWAVTLNGVPWLVSAAMVPCLWAGGRLREKMQHEFDRLTPHQELEAWLWPAGGALVLVGYWAFFG